MKIVSFKVEQEERFGILVGDQVRDISSFLKFNNLNQFIEKGDQADISLALQNSRVHSYSRLVKDKHLLPAVPQPENIYCIGLNYEEHRQETQRKKTKYPTVFIRSKSSQLAHGTPIVIPHESPCLDFEGEVAVIIGKAGRRIEKEKAFEHIYGISCYNDVSVRDWQSHTTQWTPGKNFPNTGSFGPFIVTPEDIDIRRPLTIETRLNDEVVQCSDTSLLIFPFDELISYISTFAELKPGDVIVTGTPGGVGFKRTPPLYLKNGDHVEVEVQGVGVLSNKVVNES